MNTAIVVILVLAFVVFFVVPVATANMAAANKAPLRPRGPQPLKEMFANPSDAGSIKTGLINVGDVGMPPGHIAPYYNGVIVSTTFLGPDVASVTRASPNGKYVLTVTDETGKSASVKVTNMGSGGFYYIIYNNDSTGTTISKTFANSKQLAISVAVPGPAAPPAAKAKAVGPSRVMSFEQQEYNPLSQAIDQTIANFATEPTGIEADPSLSEIEYVKQYDDAVNPVNQQIQYALAAPDMPIVNQSLPPANALARKARKCEKGLVGRASCASLTKPEFADCGVCIQGGTSMDGSNPGGFIGGLLSLKSSRTGNSVSGPNLGKCPPGMFFVDAQACQTAASQLNCAEAAPQAGRNAEGQKIPLAMCSAGGSAPNPKAVGTAMENGDVNSLVLAQKIVDAAKSSGNYDAWLQMMTTYYNNAVADGSKYINMLNNSPFGSQLAQSGIMRISGNPTASPYFGAYQTAQQGYMAATTG